MVCLKWQCTNGQINHRNSENYFTIDTVSDFIQQRKIPAFDKLFVDKEQLANFLECWMQWIERL